MVEELIGIVGWRGMAGSVLMQRMKEGGDFGVLSNLVFFSTSQAGEVGPEFSGEQPLEDAYDVDALKKCDVIVTCQGGGWTSEMYPQLRKTGWNGIWIDAASTLRMEEDSIIVLDPLNRAMIEDGLRSGVRNFIGGNCTVSLMLMACHGLFEQNLVEWVNSSTYQAASGAGAAHMQELVRQMKVITEGIDPAATALNLESIIAERIRASDFPVDEFGVPLACSVLSWIDKPVDGGQTREERKGFFEANKILCSKKPIPIDGICARVGVMRCHSQVLLIKLKRSVPMNKIENIIAEANEWVEVVPNEKKQTLEKLTPAAVSGTLSIRVGRLHKAKMGGDYLHAFTVGDQLLWGAAEPIRRALGIVLGYL